MMEQLFVIKIGGNVIDDDAALQLFIQNFASIRAKKILVHGGGKIATLLGEQLGIRANYIDGRRITDQATIDLVTMVYGGLINKKIVAKLQSVNCNAIGLTGADANTMPAMKRSAKNIDYGFVGDIDSSTCTIDSLQLFLTNNLVPVIAPLSHDGKGQMLNTNADTMASVVAIALSTLYNVKLVYCFEKKGILENSQDESSVLPLITKKIYRQLVQDRKLSAGILPKIDNALAAVDNGVKEVLIGNASALLQNCSGNITGTLVKI